MNPVVWYIAAGYVRSAGVEVYLLHYATELRKQSFDTRIIVFERLPATPHRCMRELAERGVPLESLYDAVAPLVCRRTLAKWLPWTVYTLVRGRVPRLSALRQWLLKQAAVRLLAEKIEKEKPDIVHVKGRLIAEVWPVIPAERTVFHVATRGQRDPTWTDAEVSAFRPFVSSVARVFAPGTEVAENFKREFDIERDVEVIFTMAPDEEGERAEGGDLKPEGGEERTAGHIDEPNHTGCDTDQGIDRRGSQVSGLSPQPSVLRFGTLCRLADGKGIPEVLEALAAYRDKHGREAPFTFAGEGPMETTIREFVKARGLREVAIVPVESPAQALAHMDVFVLPSVSEAMPLAVVEALMCAKPCIVTPVGGIPDLVHDGVEGVVIDPGSVAQILAAMERFADMPATQRVAFGRKARERYEDKCLPGKVAAMVADHYRGIVGAD